MQHINVLFMFAYPTLTISPFHLYRAEKTEVLSDDLLQVNMGINMGECGIKLVITVVVTKLSVC